MDLRLVSVLSFLLVFGASADLLQSNVEVQEEIVSILPNLKEGLTATLACSGRLCSRKLVETGRASGEFKFWTALFNALDHTKGLTNQFTNIVRDSNGYISWDFFFKFMGTQGPRGGAAQYRQVIEKSIQWLNAHKGNLSYEVRQNLKTLANAVLKWRKGDPNLGNGGANSQAHKAHMEVIELWEKLVKSV